VLSVSQTCNPQVIIHDVLTKYIPLAAGYQMKSSFIWNQDWPYEMH